MSDAPITPGELETAAEDRPPAPTRGPTPKGRAHMHADDVRRAPRPVPTNSELAELQRLYIAAAAKNTKLADIALRSGQESRAAADEAIAAWSRWEDARAVHLAAKVAEAS